MANKKISALPDKLNPSTADLIPIVDVSDPNNLVTKKTTLGAILQNLLTADQKGAPGGLATLDSTGKIPAAQLPDSAGSAGGDGATGATGPQGLVGPRGATGPAGYVGSDGATGLSGATGIQGVTGPSGPRGPRGYQGDIGIQGATGPKGDTGTAGEFGVTGATGVVGPEGATGPSGIGITGATGIAGPTGATGAQGPAGLTGATGLAGITGATGIVGPGGATGIQGVTGPAGPSGPAPTVEAVSGFPNKILVGGVLVEAAQGATGATGPAGYVGSDGATGPTGVVGPTGVTGVIGATGLKGDTGSTGIQGPTGAAGYVGSDGVTGATGLIGHTGPTGLKGDTGATGASGTQGLFGVTGATGPRGSSFRILGQLVEWPPSNAPSFGDMWIVVDPLPTGVPLSLAPIYPNDGVAWVESESGGDWLNLGPVIGSAGVTGATGPDGVTGPRGIQGIRGATGAVGPQGPPGSDATNYVVSVNGYTGVVSLQTDDIGLDTEFTVLSVEQGDFTNNTVVPAGTPLTTIIRRMLQKRVPATYLTPTLGLTSTVSTATIEYGSTINATLSLTWNIGDGGDATQFRYRQNGQTIQTITGSTTADFTVPTFNLTSTATFNAAADYAAGPVKLDNFNDATLPSLAAGTASSGNVVLTPAHKRYYGCRVDDTPDNDLVLGLPTSDLPATSSSGSGSDFVNSRSITRVFNPDGQYIYFAWPASLEGSTAPTFTVNGLLTSGWIKTTVQLRNEQITNKPAIAPTAYVVYRSLNKINGANVSVQVS
jgi:hypothetical protein